MTAAIATKGKQLQSLNPRQQLTRTRIQTVSFGQSLASLTHSILHLLQHLLQ
jgi:hypothetical protein